MQRGMISPGFVNDALVCLQARGIDPAPILARSGLPFPVRDGISADQYGALWLAIAEVIDDEFFGESARPMRVGSFTLLCHAILSAGNLDTALRRALRFLDLVMEDPRGELEVSGGLAQIILRDAGAPRSAFAYRTFWIIVHGITCWLVGRRIPLRRVDFRCAAPAHADDYRLFFGAPVNFDAPDSRLAFDATFLKLPSIRDERMLRHFLRRAPANILVRYRHDAGLAARIRHRLRATPTMDWPSFEELASQLRLPPSTLRRRLAQEGESYRHIKDELRRVAAETLLAQTSKPVDEVAAELGFSEPSAFYRAFRKWNAGTPSTFRAK